MSDPNNNNNYHQANDATPVKGMPEMGTVVAYGQNTVPVYGQPIPGQQPFYIQQGGSLQQGSSNGHPAYANQLPALGQQPIYSQGLDANGQVVTYATPTYVTVNTPYVDTSESTSLCLMITGIFIPLVCWINVCMHIRHSNPITKKYAQVSLVFGILYSAFFIYVLVNALTSEHRYQYNYYYYYY